MRGPGFGQFLVTDELLGMNREGREMARWVTVFTEVSDLDNRVKGDISPLDKEFRMISK